MGSTWVPRYVLPDGTVTEDEADITRLWQTAHGWVYPVPLACINRHPLKHPNVVVGHQPCIITPHRTHECETCHYVVLTPPRQEGCTHGPE